MSKIDKLSLDVYIASIPRGEYRSMRAAVEAADQHDTTTYLTAPDGRIMAAIVPVPQDSNVHANPHREPPVPLERNSVIRFGSTEDGAFDAELDGGGQSIVVSLYDLRGRAIAVAPLSDNSVRILKLQS